MNKLRKLEHQNKLLFSLVGLLTLLASLPFLIFGAATIKNLIIKATGTTANITVDTTAKLEPIEPVWNSYAQGGESSTDMIAPVITQIKALSPRYIRIDHVFDHFQVVDRNADGTLRFSFSRLDEIINSIIQTGALPFISLSYMPPVLAQGGNITAQPTDWNEWSLLVKRTIEHISGKNALNLTNVYYEVWNEPDLFGNWKYYGNKNYLTLYEYAVRGANAAVNTNAYKIGGPAITKLYKNWITAFADYISEKGLRLDFFSWHLYTANPQEYGKNVSLVTSWLFPYPTLVNLPRLITEWGFDSNINPGYDSLFSAAHTVATVRNTLAGYEQLFAFELVDGEDPAGKQLWGRWGLLTHPAQGMLKKPRYTAFLLLNQMTGEGTWVTAFATYNNGNTKLILVNYDPVANHVEAVPVTFIHLTNGNYIFKKQSLRTGLSASPDQLIQVVDTTYTTQLIMPANTITLLELEPAASPVL